MSAASNAANPDRPTVSVIIPTYNRPQYLFTAIESAARQTFRDLEIIVSDDGSSSSMSEIAQTFNDRRIRYRRNAQNLGMALNTLAAINESRGKYISILHDDDMWGENFLAKLVPHLEKNRDIVVAFSDHYIIDQHGNIDYTATEEITRYWHRHELSEQTYRPFYYIGLVRKSIPMVMAAVVRKSAIDWSDFPADVGSVYDFWITYLACRTGLGAYYHPERLTSYRVHAQSETSTGRVRVSQAQIYCYKRFMHDDRIKEFRAVFQDRYILWHANLGINMLRAGQPAEARRYLQLALKQAPNLRTGVALVLSLVPGPWLQQLLRKPATASPEKSVRCLD